MSTKAELQALIERVKAATGPDRELDHAVVEVAWGKCDLGSGRYAFPPPVTGNLDAITTLIKQEMPGWARGFDAGSKTIIAFVDQHDYADRMFGARYTATGATPALALTAAFLSAMIAQMEPSHAE